MSQKFRIRGVVAVAVVAALVAVMAPSAMADTTDVAKTIAVAKTGSSGRDLAGREVKGHGLTVSPAKSKDGKILRTLVQDRADGVTALAVLEEGQSSAVFHGMLPAGSKVTAADGGDHHVVTPDGTRLTVKVPWARDAAGKSLPTSYTFAAGNITQYVDTAGATFPVVADPTISFGAFLYVHFNRQETFQLWNAQNNANFLSVLCGLAGPGAVICGVVVLVQINDLKATISAAVHAFSRCAGVRVFLPAPFGPLPGGGGYAGSFTEAC